MFRPGMGWPGIGGQILMWDGQRKMGGWGMFQPEMGMFCCDSSADFISGLEYGLQ